MLRLNTKEGGAYFPTKAFVRGGVDLRSCRCNQTKMWKLRLRSSEKHCKCVGAHTYTSSLASSSPCTMRRANRVATDGRLVRFWPKQTLGCVRQRPRQKKRSPFSPLRALYLTFRLFFFSNSGEFQMSLRRRELRLFRSTPQTTVCRRLRLGPRASLGR